MNNCRGIVLHQQEYRENDMIITIITKEYGILSVIGKGIKKTTSKNASACSLFCLSNFSFLNKRDTKMPTLKTAERIQQYYHIYESLEKQVIASLVCESARKSDCNPSVVFDLIIHCLEALNTTDNIYGILGFFFSQMNIYSGIKPQVDHCVNCKDTHRIVSISNTYGGFLCESCTQDNIERQTIEQLRYFRLFHKANITDLSILLGVKQYTYSDVENILYFFMENSGIVLKGYPLLKKIV